MIDIPRLLEESDLKERRFSDMEAVEKRVEAMTFPIRDQRRRIHNVSYSRIGRCIRGGFFDSLGYPEPIYAPTKINFEFGTDRHNAIQDFLIQEGVLRVNPDDEPFRSLSEFKLTLETPPVKGYCDGIFSGSDDLIEIKTTSKSLIRSKLPQEDHIQQGMFYIYMARVAGFDPSQVIILYETKRDEEVVWKQFEVPYNEKVAKRMVGSANLLMRHLEEMKVPQKDLRCWCKNPACHDIEVWKKEGLTW